MNTDGKSETGSPANPEPNESNSGSVPPSNGQNQSIPPNQKNNTKPVQKATGPRTLAGKRRSRQNATKFGIFSCMYLWDDEQRKEFGPLLKDLRNSKQPVGKFEEYCVERAAVIIWRLRRVHIAEEAEIRRSQELGELARKQQQHLEAEDQARKTTKENSALLKNPIIAPLLQTPTETTGMIWHTANNLELMDRCCELLKELRGIFDDDGFCGDAERILGKIYGERGQEHLRETLFDTYSKCSERAKDAVKRKEDFLAAIDTEIEPLKRSREEQLANESRRAEIERLRQLVPDSPGFERLMKRETSLTRELDRALNQLDHLQRMRLGQPVKPEVPRN